MRSIKAGKHKIILLAAVLIFTVILTMLLSCENIASDAVLDDLGKILSVIIGDDDNLTEEQNNPAPIAENISVTDDDINFYEEFEESEEYETDDIADTENRSDTLDFSEQSEIIAETAVSPVSSEGVLSDAVRYFPEMPDTFKYVPFPDALTMNDPLKRTIRDLDHLLKKDYSGGNFFVATTNPELLTPGRGGDTLNNARYYRTQLVETAYNIRLQSVLMDRENIYQTITNSVRAGEYISDIVCAPIDVQSLFIQSGLLINLRKMPFMNLNADYYNKSSVQANTVNGEIYGVVSDLLFEPNKIYAVFYNKNLLKTYGGMENLDELYENNKWTYDEMLGLCKTMAGNVDTAANDLFTIGFSQENDDIVNGMYISADFPPPVGIELASVTEKIQDTVSRIINNRDGISPLISNDDAPQKNAFSQGSMLFALLTLDMIPEITDTDFNWGILPMPAVSVNETHLYPSVVSFTKGSSLCLSILRNVPNTEKCGIIAEALSLASHDYMREMYVSELMTYNLRDMTSVNMVDKILDNVMYRNMNR